MVKEMHIPYEAFLGGATCVPQVWVSKAAGFTAAWLVQLFGERWSAEQEVAGSNPGQTNTQGL